MFFDRFPEENGQTQLHSAKETITSSESCRVIVWQQIKALVVVLKRYNLLPPPGVLCRINFIRKLIPEQKKSNKSRKSCLKTKT
jgi:hypothetical protein